MTKVGILPQLVGNYGNRKDKIRSETVSQKNNI